MSVRLTFMMLFLAVGFAAGAHAGEARHRESAAPRTDFEIFSVGVDGKQRRNLSRTSFEDRDPVLSPNGRRIVFMRWSNGPDDPRDGLWLMNSNGSGQRKLPGTERLGSPIWSPDGTRLALQRATYDPPAGYSYDVVVMRLADGQLTTIENASNPTWAPDGTRLAFLSDPLPSFRAGFRNLSVADADGTNRRVVFTMETGINFQPVWSTRGSLVAVTFHDFSLQVIDTETGNLRTVARQGWTPSWSPDGRRLAFASYRGIGVTRVARPSTRLLVSSRHGYGSVTPHRPLWSPNGRSIAFITKHQLRVVDVASGRFRVVTRSSTGFTDPGWSPSGRRLYFAARLPA